jgi:hypothetical protein
VCDRCGQIDDQTHRYRKLAKSIRDESVLKAIVRLIAELEAEKLALHPATGKEATSTPAYGTILPKPGLTVWSPVGCRQSGGRSTKGLPMPWTPNDAEKHTHKAVTPELRELWAKVANERLEKTGDEGRAIREANSVVGRQAGSGT